MRKSADDAKLSPDQKVALNLTLVKIYRSFLRVRWFYAWGGAGRVWVRVGCGFVEIESVFCGRYLVEQFEIIL